MALGAAFDRDPDGVLYKLIETAPPPGSTDAVSVMKRDVEHAVSPIFFVEPMNDHSIQPTIELTMGTKQLQP